MYTSNYSPVSKVYNQHFSIFAQVSRVKSVREGIKQKCGLLYLVCIWNKLEISFCSNKSGCKTQTFRDQEKYPQVNCARFSSLVWSCHVLSRHAKGINISTNAPFLVKISTEKRMIAPRIGIQIQYLTAMSVGAPRVGKDLCNDNKRGNNIPPPP